MTDFDSLAGMVMDPKSGTEGFVINAFGKSVTFPKPMVISIKQQYDYMRRKKNIIASGTEVRVGEHVSDVLFEAGFIKIHHRRMSNINYNAKVAPKCAVFLPTLTNFSFASHNFRNEGLFVFFQNIDLAVCLIDGGIISSAL